MRDMGERVYLVARMIKNKTANHPRLLEQMFPCSNSHSRNDMTGGGGPLSRIGG